MVKHRYSGTNPLIKTIKKDKHLKEIYFKIKDNLPEWLDDKIICIDPIFITQSNNHQELLMLIMIFLSIDEVLI